MSKKKEKSKPSDDSTLPGYEPVSVSTTNSLSSCPTCGGTGANLSYTHLTETSRVPVTAQCSTCHGSGSVPQAGGY